MNAGKCVCMRFRGRYVRTVSLHSYRISGQPIEFADKHSELGVEEHRSLQFHSHTRRTTGTCGGLTTNILSSTLCREAGFLLNIYKSHIRPKLEYCSCAWNLNYVGDLRLIESIQRRWTRSVRGLENASYDQRLQQLDLFSMKGRLLRADLIMVWKIFNGHCAISPDQLFTMNSSSRRGHPLKIFVQRPSLEVRRRSFAVRVVRDWNSLPAETVMAQSLETFKRLLQRDLGQRLFEFN